MSASLLLRPGTSSHAARGRRRRSSCGAPAAAAGAAGSGVHMLRSARSKAAAVARLLLQPVAATNSWTTLAPGQHACACHGAWPRPHIAAAVGSGSDAAAAAPADAAATQPAAGHQQQPPRADSSATSGSRVINKQPIGSVMTPRLYEYLLSVTREHPLLAALREETAGMHGGHMQISPEQGALLALLVELTGAKRALEVGVFTGYSSLAVVLALPPDGTLVAMDRDAASMAVAQRYWAAAGMAGKVEPRLGAAADSLAALLARDGEGSYDLAFIDADKRGYVSYYEAALRLLRPGGLLVADNVLFYGRVAEPAPGDKAGAALAAFNAHVAADERVSLAVLPVGDGMALCRKR